MPLAIEAVRTMEKLPAFPEKEYIDVGRACRIYGVTWLSIRQMAEAGYIHMIEYRPDRGLKKVRYQSVVDHCDRLRAEYLIPDLRPPLSSSLFRHRDEDLLPFRLSDTINMEAAAMALGYSAHGSVVKLIERGCFWAYKLRPQAPWRVSTTSLRQYLDGVVKGIAGRTPNYNITG